MKCTENDILDLAGNDMAIIKSKNCKKMVVITADKHQTNGLKIEKLTKSELKSKLQNIDLCDIPSIASKFVFKGRNVYVAAAGFCNMICVAEICVDEVFKYEISIVNRKEVTSEPTMER